MKTKLMKRLAIAAVLLSGSSMVRANDGSSVIGDLPGYGEEAYFNEEAAYADEPSPHEARYDESYGDEEFVYEDEGYADQGVAPVAHQERRVVRRPARTRAVSQRNYAPIGANELQPASHEMHMGPVTMGPATMGSTQMGAPVHMDMGGDCGCGTSSCGSSCGSGSCGSGSCGSSCGTSRRMTNLFNRGNGNTWASMELLLWFAQDRDSPTLIAEAPAGTLPIEGDPGVIGVFGNDFEGELSPGFRTDAGVWLSENVGVGGRFWYMGENEDEYSFSGNGDGRSVGRTFFNTQLRGEDSLPIALTNAVVGPDLSGSITASDSLDLWAAEAYARLRFGCSKSCSLDFIGGYSHFQVDNSLRIGSTTRIEGTGAAPFGGSAVGDQLSYLDRFDTENEFNGGQLGFEMSMNRGRWIASSLTKVHLGNMSQRIAISGSTVNDPIGSAAVTTAGGILAGSDPVDVTRDVFTFAPEANFKLAYQFRKNVALSVGYSFIYFDNVALTGDVIDRNVNGAAIGTLANDNGFFQDDSSLWVHGVDLGFVIDF